MPFKPDLRKRLQDLKSEFEAGVLPQSVYEDMCRTAINDAGNDPFESFSRNYGNDAEKN